ncbi:TPA: hypothetical protein U0K67_002110, partial [Streptococcus suis]|nr:hypothetical protein [Streptococcus suis]
MRKNKKLSKGILNSVVTTTVAVTPLAVGAITAVTFAETGLMVVNAMEVSTAVATNQSGIDAISANNGQYTVTSEHTNFKWTDILKNPIIVLKMTDGSYKYKKFSDPVTVDKAKAAYAAGEFVDAATYKVANGPLQADDKVYIIQESDFTTDPTSISIEESYDLTKFHHRQNLVLGGDSFSEGATIEDAASDSVLIALARPGSFVSEIEFKDMENPGSPSIYLPKENNTLLVVDNIREAVEQAGPNDQSYTNFGLFLSHIAVSDDKVNKPNTVMKLPEGVEVVFADSSGQQTTFHDAMNEIMNTLQYNNDEWKVLNPQQKLKFKFIVKKDGRIIQEDKNWREITLHVYNTLDEVKNLVKTTLENTENDFTKGIVDNIDFSGLPEVMKNEAVEMERKYPNVDGSTPQDGALPQFLNPTNKQYNWINKDKEESNGNHATSPARYFPYDMDLFQGDGDDITEALRGYIPYINDYIPGNSGETAKIEPSDHDKELIDYYSLGPIFAKTMLGHNFTPEQGGVNESYWNSLVQDAPIPQLDFEPKVNLDIVTLSISTPPSTPQPKTYNVTHTFVKAASVPENIELPEAIKSKIESSYNYTDVVNGDSRTPNSAINTDRYEDADNDGVWTFNRWQQDSVTVENADAELVGEWNFTPNKYKITHEFKVADGVTIALPDAIKNRITEASNLTDLLNGSDNQPNPAINTDRYEDADNDGTWTFTGWDKTNHVINKADGHFVGTWTFTPSTLAEKPAKVVHEFVSGTPDKELPQEVKDLLPSDFDTKFDETVRPTTPTETTVKVSDGTWTFTSYDADSKVVDEAEEKFVGTWTFTPSEAPAEKPAKVVHEFVSGTPDKELPQEVKALLPSGF